MKKIYQLGFIASLIALLPTGMLFAGNGDGKDSKNTVSITRTATTEMVTLTILSNEPITMKDITISSRTDWSHITGINPIPGGVEVVIDVDHSVQMTGAGDDIIIDIVGVDNITGVNTTDGNTGNSVPTNIVFHKGNETTATSNNDGTGFHQGPSNNGNDIGNNNPTVIFNGTKDDISIYPNPVRSETNVVTVGEILGKEIEIMDLSGNVVLNMIVNKGSRQTVLDLSMLNPGLYILSYKTDDGKVISKKIQKI